MEVFHRGKESRFPTKRNGTGNLMSCIRERGGCTCAMFGGFTGGGGGGRDR